MAGLWSRSVRGLLQFCTHSLQHFNAAIAGIVANKGHCLPYAPMHLWVGLGDHRGTVDGLSLLCVFAMYICT